jgi:hypothetical protein
MIGQPARHLSTLPSPGGLATYSDNVQPKRCSCCEMEAALLPLLRRNRRTPLVYACPDCDRIPLSRFIRQTY